MASLFERDHAKASFRAREISIGHLAGDRWKHTVLTPEDVNAWTLAHYFVLQGGAHMVVLSGHPTTHFPYDTVNAVTQSAVPMRHTLFKLLKPHLRFQLAVDNAVLEGGNSVVSEARGTFYAPFAGPSADIRQLVAAGYLGYPNVLSKFAPGDVPGLAYPRWAYPMVPKAIPSDFGRYLEAYFNTVKDYVREVGQLGLSCAQCHDDNAGKRLGGSTIPQRHANGDPLYRLEWQTLGSLQRRLRNCMTGLRAEPFAFGAPELEPAHVPSARVWAGAKPDLDEVAVGSSAQAVEHVDEVKALIPLYYVVTTAKLNRYCLNHDAGEAGSSTAVPHDLGIS